MPITHNLTTAYPLFDGQPNRAAEQANSQDTNAPRLHSPIIPNMPPLTNARLADISQLTGTDRPFAQTNNRFWSLEPRPGLV